MSFNFVAFLIRLTASFRVSHCSAAVISLVYSYVKVLMFIVMLVLVLVLVLVCVQHALSVIE